MLQLKKETSNHAQVSISVEACNHKEAPSRETLFFPMLDIVRAACTASVLVFHAIELFEWESFPGKGPLAFFRSGWLGVDFFYVLSGFVIGLSTFAAIDKHGEGFRWEFMKHRIIRIAPLHYLTCFVYVLVHPQVLQAKNFVWDALAHTAFVHNIFLPFHGSINGANWTLGVEMQFYLLMALVGPILYKASIGKSWAALTIIAWAWRSVLSYLYPPNAPEGHFRLFFLATQLPGTLDQFALGVLLARVVRTAEGRRQLSRMQGCKMSTMITGIVAFLTIHVTYKMFLRRAGYWSSRYMVIAFDTQLAIAAGTLIVFACCIPVTRFTEIASRPLRYIGTISYSIYLWHFPTMHVLLKGKGSGRLASLDVSSLALFAIFLTLCISSLSWHFFEKKVVDAFRTKRPLVPSQSNGEGIPRNK